MFAFTQDLTGVQRTNQANTRLGAALAFIAGAANAGGFLAVGQYTSHMTGVVSSIADHLVLGQALLVFAAVSSLAAFVGGAASTAVLVNWGMRRGLVSAYCLPLLVEAVLLLVFGVFGAAVNVFPGAFVPLTVLLLCYIMGLQNAVITKISRSEIRTTHVTGLVTDIGIELGKLLYVNRAGDPSPVMANRVKLKMQSLLVGSFFAGGVVGAVGFKSVGYVATLLLAVALVVLCARPVLQDLRRMVQQRG
jgi:uncharacterized membrane protein YoaK (UPF0700 family)